MLQTPFRTFRSDAEGVLMIVFLSRFARSLGYSIGYINAAAYWGYREGYRHRYNQG
jgi:hypothetical protein